MYRSELNIDQRHFPMLREYEKAKQSLLINAQEANEEGPLNNDLSDANQTFFGNTAKGSTHSPFQNFVRATTGKKLYYNDKKSGPLPPSKVTEPTELHKSRQRVLYRAENGIPLQKATHNVDFVPPNLEKAKDNMKSKNWGLFDDEYDLKKQHDFYMAELNKQKRLNGPFKKSYYVDNGKAVDVFGNIQRTRGKTKHLMGHSTGMPLTESKNDLSTSASMSQTRLRNTNSKFENNLNMYSTFLNDKGELPRLSILDNYK